MANIFEKFLEQIENVVSQKHAHGALLQLTIRNFDQLATICCAEEIAQFDSLIRGIVNEMISSQDHSDIFEYNKFYYFLLDEVDEDIIANIAYSIHQRIISSISIQYLLDTRIAGIKLDKEVNIRTIAMLLADHVHYTDDAQIFKLMDNPSMIIDRIKDDYALLGELREAISLGLACFAFQPVIECKTGKIEYYECLLRLSNDNYKLVSAGKYISLAEKMGYITIVDKYVFDMAISELQAAEDINLSVNISNIGVGDKLLVEYILKLIENAGVGNRLRIEITETAMNANYEQTKNFVQKAKKLGCKIALDDFGAGYNSFNQVRDFSIDVLKIDGTYIRDLDVNQKNQVLVSNIIKMADELGCKTVAEFVESGSIAKNLINMNIDYMQGNFFSPAVNYRSWEKK